jgi:hypothetical protein
VHIRALAEALRVTGKGVCLNLAAKLDALGMNASSFDLHLRQAGLDRQDAVNIAEAVEDLPASIAPSMRSFSVSYNPSIEDTGAIALIGSLPASTTEIGMVGCGLGDKSGEVLLDWTRQAPALRMLCVEKNEFSSRMRGRLSKLRGSGSGLAVTV